MISQITSRLSVSARNSPGVPMGAKKRTGEAARVESPMETYFRQINEIPLLTADQEHTLADRIKEGDMEARDRMIRANLRLVVNIARNYTGRGLHLQDLIEEGNMGLIRAVEGYDKSYGTRFSTYASYWVTQSIKRGLAAEPKVARIPAYMLELLAKWRRHVNAMKQKTGKTPAFEEVAQAVGITKRQHALVKKALVLTQMAAYQEPDSDEKGLGLNATACRHEAPDAQAEMQEELAQIRADLKRLNQREQTVIQLRFGLNDDEAMTLKDIGKRLGLTRERVRQIEAEALAKLRAAYE